MAHGRDTSGIDLTGKAKDFDRVARRWGVDYSLRRVEKGKYLLLFKASQADAMTACFSEYSRHVLKRAKNRPAPIREQFDRAAEQARQQTHRERELVKEAAREDR